MKATTIDNIRLEMSPEHKNSNVQSKVEWQMNLSGKYFGILTWS